MKPRGFALAAVLFALVLLAALTAAGFFASLQEVRAGRNAAGELRAQTAATSSLSSAIAGWDPLTLNALAVGAIGTPVVPAIPGVSLQIEARRLSPRFFLLRSTATYANAATRTAAVLVRLRGLDLTPRAAVRARGIAAAAASRIDGADQPPPGWNCPATRDTITPLITQPSAIDSVFLRFGSRDWPSLVQWVAAVPPGGDSIAARYEPGSLRLDGSRTLGLLVVEGDLTLAGGARLVGLVVVRGSLLLEGSGGTVNGALIASQIITQQGYTPNGPFVSYSSCSALAASLGRAYAERVPGQPTVSFY